MERDQPLGRDPGARIRGNGRVVRDYVPVAHLIALICASLEQEWEPGRAHVVNVGSGIGLTNGEVGRAVSDLLRPQGYTLHIECDAGLTAAEPMVSVLNVADTTRRLGIPPPALDAVWKGIEETVLDSLRRTSQQAQAPERPCSSPRDPLPLARQDSAS